MTNTEMILYFSNVKLIFEEGLHIENEGGFKEYRSLGYILGKVYSGIEDDDLRLVLHRHNLEFFLGGGRPFKPTPAGTRQRIALLDRIIKDLDKKK